MDTSSLISLFDTLGHALEQKFRRANYDPGVFPTLAIEALAKADLPRHVAASDVARWALATPVLPPQNDPEGDFSDLPITLFRGSRFIVDVYYWMDGTTSVHQHGFAGAFQVLAGASVLGRYDFEERRIVNEHFAVGALTLAEVELLSPGDIRPILPGRQYIHSLFHLQRPSVTIVVRTNVPSAGPQYDYHRPHVALNPFYRNPELSKRVHCAALLVAINDPDADAIVGDLVASADFHTAYTVLNDLQRRLKPSKLEALFERQKGRDRFGALLERARSAHGDLVDVIPPVIAERERQLDIVMRRRAVAGEAHRFLLALLLNVQEPEHLLTLVQRRMPDRDPVDVVVEWLDELARLKIFGSDEPNVLNLEGYGADHRRALERSLRGCVEPADMPFLQQLDTPLLGMLTRGAANGKVATR